MLPAEQMEDLVLAVGSMNNEEVKPWKAATGKILSQGTVMKVQLPLIAAEFSAAIQRYIYNISSFFAVLKLVMKLGKCIQE
jgi:hypothetical protein